MQIGEVAKRTALSVDAIRFYERRALLPKAPRSAGRFRLYGGDDVARLGFIREMQGLGFELERLERELALDHRKCNRELKHGERHAPRTCPILTSSNASGKRRDVPC